MINPLETRTLERLRILTNNLIVTEPIIQNAQFHYPPSHSICLFDSFYSKLVFKSFAVYIS